MKNLLTALFLLALNIAEGQYFQQRFNFNYAIPALRNERLNSGIRTRVNFINGDTSFFYFAGIGTSYNNTALAAPDNLADRMRFTLLGTRGITVFGNLSYQFSDGDDKWFNASGNSISEIKNATLNGGYVAVGAVTNNSLTDATTIAGNSDALFVRLDAAGSVINSVRYNINNGEDIAWYLRKSRVPDQQGRATWILCGESKHPNYTDCFVARVRVNGSIVWCNRYNFDPTPQGGISAHCIAKQLCEDAMGNIYVVGTLQDNQGGGFIKGLAFKLAPGGAVQWANNYDAGSDNEFQAVRLTADNRLIVGGFTSFGAAAPVTHNMLIVKLNRANGSIVFQNILQALANNGITKYTSKCYDIIETGNPQNPQYFLAGFLIRNGENVQMMYKTGAAGMGINWYPYNVMVYNVGFGLDNVDAGSLPGVAYFSSLKNPDDNTFSDSHIMKTNYQGKTCMFCGAKPPGNIAINQEVHNRDHWLQMPAEDPHKLASKTYNYQNKLICNESEIHCSDLPAVASARQSEDAIVKSKTTGMIKVSPNPVSNILHIEFNTLPAGEYQIILMDVGGKPVLKTSVNNSGSSSTDLNMSSIASGFYVLTVKQGAVILQQKVVKQ